MKKRTNRKSAFTLVEIMIVVAIIGLLAAIAIPNFVHARTTSYMNSCINNLRQINGAVQEYALENKQAAAAAVTLANITSYLKDSCACPAGGTTIGDSYAVTDCQTAPTCILKWTPSFGQENAEIKLGFQVLRD